MGLMERSVRTLKEILRKNNDITQLQLQEHIYAVNCKEEGETGLATTRFIGRGTRTGLRKSWEFFVDWREQIKKRGEQKEKRVQKRKEQWEKKHKLKAIESACKI